jgi:hypothetical protein
MSGTINFTKQKLAQLKKEYKVAVDQKAEIFIFDGEHEMLISYAKYLIEYLESRF